MTFQIEVVARFLSADFAHTFAATSTAVPSVSKAQHLLLELMVHVVELVSAIRGIDPAVQAQEFVLPSLL